MFSFLPSRKECAELSPYIALSEPKVEMPFLRVSSTGALSPDLSVSVSSKVALRDMF